MATVTLNGKNPANRDPFAQFGVWNEHWSNHPAGLPRSQYKPNTNPNQGSQSYEAWLKTQNAQQNQNQQSQTSATQTQNTQTTQTTSQGGAGQTPAPQQADPNRFSSRYTPAMLDQVYENPWYILRDVFGGVNESSPLYQALRDLGGDPLTLFNIAQGSQQTLDAGSGDFVDWLAQMYANMGSVGGTGFDARQLLTALFGQNAFGADAQSTLGQILGAGDMSTQIRTLYNMARDVSNVAMNPLAARGYQAALAQAGDRYGQQMLSASGENQEGPQNPSAWIRENMPWLALA